MSDTPTYTILFLDDDEFIVDMYSLKFTEAGHRFHAAMDAESALQQLRDGLQPDAILTDLVMPGTDGFAFMEAVRSEGLAPEAALIVLSNQSNKEDLARARELGAVGHIVKANTIPSEVVGIVEKLIAKHKRQGA